MPVIEWDDHLVLDRGVMDDTHREFIGLLNRLAEAPDNEMPELLDEFIKHTEAHFGQEEAWMEALQFPPLGCHRTEHEGVLEIMREVRKRIAGGETHFGEVLARAVAEWFPLHAGSMDVVLALYMQQTGFEPPAPAGVPKESGAA